MSLESQLLKRITDELNAPLWTPELLGMNSIFPDLDIHRAAKSLPHSEISAADWLAYKLSNHVSYIASEDVWYVWDGQIHRPFSKDSLVSKIVKCFLSAHNTAMDTINSELIRLAKSDAEQSEEKASKGKYRKDAFKKHNVLLTRLGTDAGIGAVVRALKYTDLQKDDDHFLDDRRWFVMENGVFDMDAVRATGKFELLPHDASRSVYRMFPATFDPEAKHPALDKFLTGSIADESQARFFSKAVALSMFGGADAKTKTIVSIQGATNSGKSMIQNLLSQMCGKESNFVATPNKSAITDAGAKKDHARYPMRNARYVAFSEVREALDHEFLLKYSGGDPYGIEEKYIAGSTVTAQGIIFIANNTSLNVDKTDPAMFARIAPINFPHTFRKVDVDPAHIEDTELPENIKKESSGFINWMVASYSDYLANGLDKSESMEALLREEKANESSYLQFMDWMQNESSLYAIDDIASASTCVMASVLHTCYVNFCKEHDVKKSEVLNLKYFKHSLEQDGYEIVRSNGTRVKKVRTLF